MILSVPFVSNQYEIVVRDRIEEYGEIDHLLKPEYHGNSVGSDQGSLWLLSFWLGITGSDAVSR